MRKIIKILMVVILILGMMQVTIPVENLFTQASLPPPPDDGVNGAYTQYIDGDWVVTGNESYTDEVIVLNGSLIVQENGFLTLQNVTLMMNCTQANGQYRIEVSKGGSLVITDVDNDPATTEDASNITDSTYDIDNGNTSDYRYYITILKEGSFSMTNSFIRECGYNYNTYTNGLYIEEDDVNIENCTFKDNYYGIDIASGENFKIKNNKFIDCYYGLNTKSTVSNCIVTNNEAYACSYGLNLGGDNFVINDNKAHNNSKFGISLSYLDNSKFYDNIMKYNGGTSWTHNLYIGGCDNLDVYNNTIQKLIFDSYHAVMITRCANLNFHHNIITYNDDQAIRCDFGKDADTNIKFYNNNISNNNGSGLVVYGRYDTDNYIEIKNNIFYKNKGYGLQIAQFLAYTITNNTISSDTGGSQGVFVDATQNGDFSNNTIDTTSTHFQLLDNKAPNDDTFFEVVNCSFDPSKVWHNNGYATIIIKNFLHVNVTDLNGPVPNADISVKYYGGNVTYTGKTGNDGFDRFIKLTNQTQSKTISGIEITYFDPHNITATSYGKTAYGEIEPTMNISQIVKVHFNYDLPPQKATELTAVSNGLNIDLNWVPSYSPDLDHYLVYRNGTGASWVEVYNSSLILLKETWANWTDVLGARNWSTYWYKVVAVDAGFHRSADSNIAKCGDWAIHDNRILKDLFIRLNGSLIVLPTGDLTLKNITVSFNSTIDIKYGIEVNPGGKLSILDKDNDPLTTYDRSNITAQDENNNTYMIVTGAEIVIKNSKISYCGSNEELDFKMYMNSGPLVMSRGDPTSRGVYIANSTATIESNEFSNNFVSILLDGTNNSNIVNNNNTFSNNVFDIYLNNSNENTIVNNKFINTQGIPIFIFNSKNNSIVSNEMINPATTDAGIGLYGSECSENDVKYNNITDGENGIYLYLAGSNNNISYNRLRSLDDKGIMIYRTSENFFFGNRFNNSNEYDYYLDRSDLNYIIGGTSNWAETGIWIESSNNIRIANFVFENASEFAIVERWSNNILVINITVVSCFEGFGVAGGTCITFSDVSIINSTHGLVLYWSAKDIKLRNSQIGKGTQEAILIIDGQDLKIINCTLNATIYNFNLTNAAVTLYNTTYNQSKVTLDKSSRILLHWYLDVKVYDWFNQSAAFVNVQIRKVMGTIVFNGFTCPNGYVRGLVLLERTQFYQSNGSLVPYLFGAYSENHSGVVELFLNRSTLVTIYLENEVPEAKNVIINPLNPDTKSKLTLSYTYSDHEFDPEGKTILKWYVDGVYKSQYDNLTEIDNGFTKKGQIWHCEIQPHDSAAYGESMISTPVNIRNTKPEITGVEILETAPRSDENLTLNYLYSDIDNDPEVGSQNRWYKDTGSGWEYSNIDSQTLSAGYTNKGEQWKCIVKPYDGETYGDEVESAPVTIGNTPPTVANAKVIPTNPQSNQTLTVSYEFFDLDTDPELGSIIKWHKNDKELPELEGSPSVPLELTKKGDKWYYQITPSDGEDLGSPLESDPVVIGNTAPIVVDIIIFPENPTTSDDLTVIYDFMDDDFDLESFETNVQWLRKRTGDVDFAYTGLRVKTLSSIYTNKNEVWTCEVTPHDNYTYGQTLRAVVDVAILNSKPTVDDLFITQDRPTTKNDLEANYQFFDLDGDIESGTEIKWYRDQILVPELNNKLIIGNSNTLKGEVWYFAIRPKDGDKFGELVKSNTITIYNSAPTLNDLVISPRFPLGDDDLIASYSFIDADDDSESSTEIRWYKNGLLQAFYNDQLVVESNATEKAELWYFTLIAFDGTDHSDMVQSHYVTIENSKAIISSIDPSPGDVILNETESVEFYVDAVDPDGDKLDYTWKLDKGSVGSGEYYLFKTDYETSGQIKSAGNYILNLSLQDYGKRPFTITLIWRITVNNVNRPPQIEIKEPITKNPKIKENTKLKFLIDESDPDSEDTLNITITWYFDDNVVQDGGSAYTYFADYSAAGKHVVSVVVSDGKIDTGTSWNVTVKESSDELIFGKSYDWWGLIMAILSGIGAILLFFFGVIMMRKKKSKLRKYMNDIDKISDSDKNSKDKEQELLELKKKIKLEFADGLITESHYIILEREVDDVLGYTRTAIVKEGVVMPDVLKEDVEEVLEDGIVTMEEYKAIVDRVRSTKELSPLEKNKLNNLLSRWMLEHKKEDMEKITKQIKSKSNLEKKGN